MLMRRLVGVVTGVLALCCLLSGPAAASVISMVGDDDCFGLGGACPDGTQWRDGLGGVFFTNYQGIGDPSFTDKWSSDVAPSYSHAFIPDGGPVAGLLEIRIAGVADSRGPWDVFGDGMLLGQIPTNNAADAFQEVVTYAFGVPGALLFDGSLDVLLNINVPTVTDGYSIDFSKLTVETSAIPEPGTLMLLSSGLFGLIARRRRAS